MSSKIKQMKQSAKKHYGTVKETYETLKSLGRQKQTMQKWF
jgi:hypothetical protein